MKTGFIPLLLLPGAISLSSCTKDTGERILSKGNAAVMLSIGVPPSEGTKVQTNLETTVNRLQIGIYDNAGRLEWDNDYDKAFTTVKTITGLVEGDKTIVAVANKAITMPATLEDFYDISVSLDENRRDAFVMSGSEKTEASVSPGITTILLKRAVAKITVRSSLSTVWNDGKSHNFNPQRIYLSNVATKTNLRGDAFDEFANLREDIIQTDNEIIRNLTIAQKDYWTAGGVFNHGVDFYVCPNTSAKRKTTLLIQAEFDGQLCYYPLVVADTLLRNTMYRCGSVVISCPGMPAPDDEFTSIRVLFGYEPQDWDRGQTADSTVFE